MKSSSLYPFSDILRSFREREHISQQELARRLGVHRNTLGGWERGDYLPNTHADILKIVDVLNLNEQDKETLLQARYSSTPATEQPGDLHWFVPHRRNPYFTGQSRILEHLHNLLMPAKKTVPGHLQAISGLGGVGKTQVALEYAYRYRQHYQAVLWVRAETSEEWSADYALISQSLGLAVKDEQDQSRIVEAVKKWLARQTGWLLILDNLEDFQLIDTFLPSLYDGSILVTTRSGLAGSLVQALFLEKMNEEEAALLLLRKASAQSTVHTLHGFLSVDIVQAREIVNLVDALPLALDQAGSYIQETQCGLAGYLQRYRSWHTDLLKRRGKLPSGHPASVFSTFSLTITRVRQICATSVVFLQLCAFTAPEAIPIEVIMMALSHIVSSPSSATLETPFLLDEIIEVLRGYSLVRRDAEVNTITVHRLVQAVLREELPAEKSQSWLEQLLHAFARLLPEDVTYTTWARWQRYMPHLLSCLDSNHEEERAALVTAGLLDRLGLYLQERAQYVRSEDLLQQALQSYEQHLGPDDLQVATALLHLANLYHQNGKYNQAEPLYIRIKALRIERLGLKHTQTAQIINDLALLYLDQGKYQQAEPLFQQALAINRQVLSGEHADLASILGNLALLSYKQKNYAQAEQLYQEAMEIDRQAWGEQHPRLALDLHDLALVYTACGKY
ncbi:MAG TPA: FxSxx-COOH system tetratricopeptide repeat protein, partial [Ktedonobacteraceae bacterium]|nr:FxSxx-COOH system tetratricopeptide repeat protein [Ktedonobacteraceae bacterium]